MLLHFIGQRQKPFTVDSPTGLEKDGLAVTYYVEPGQPVKFAEADAKALLKRDPGLWSDKPPAEMDVGVLPEEIPADTSNRPSGASQKSK